MKHFKTSNEGKGRLNDLLIYHLYADEGVESDYLTRFGRVIRVGLDPVDRNSSEPITADVEDLPLRPCADLAIAHPECGPWNEMSEIHDNKSEQPKQIKAAREICQQVADHYIIENVADAPLKDPVVLEGSYFGLPITKERAFETSFHTPQPQLQQTIHDHCEMYDRYERPRRWWESVMGVDNWYPIDQLVNSGIPRTYIEYLLQAYFLEAGTDRKEATNKSQTEPKTRHG
jgi:hypothetical protein